jgi:hypothetical protein
MHTVLRRKSICGQSNVIVRFNLVDCLLKLTASEYFYNIGRAKLHFT